MKTTSVILSDTSPYVVIKYGIHSNRCNFNCASSLEYV